MLMSYGIYGEQGQSHRKRVNESIIFMLRIKQNKKGGKIYVFNPIIKDQIRNNSLSAKQCHSLVTSYANISGLSTNDNTRARIRRPSKILH
jgi:hypothetical protein